MNQAALFFVFMTLSSLTQQSMAGNGSGGGGFAITCRSAQGKIERAELLDLYEARTIFNRTLIASNGNTKDDYLAAVKNMKTLRSDAPSVESASITFDGYYKAFEFVKPGKVPQMNDMGEVPPAPTGCQYEQVAAFGYKEITGPGGSIWPILTWEKIDSEIWGALDSQSQAALIFHEFLYIQYRYLGDKTSQNVRTDVGIVFSEGITPAMADIPSQRQSCLTTNGKMSTLEDANPRSVSRFAVFPFEEQSGLQGLRFQLDELMGRKILSKTTVFFSDLQVLSFEKNTLGEILVSDPTANYTKTADVSGEQTAKWQIELRYIYKKPAILTLIIRGQRVASFPMRCAILWPR